jgi:hypothetical protein
MATTEKSPSKAKAEFEEFQNASLHAEAAKVLGSDIFKKITSRTQNNALAEIHKKIGAAASQNDDAALETLFAELKKAKTDLKNTADQYKTVRNSNTFEFILQAYSEEFRELAYEVAAEVIKGAHVAIKGAKSGSKTRTTSTEPKEPREKKDPVAYTITSPDGKKATIHQSQGPVAHSKDKEAYELLGFKFGADNKNVTAENFKHTNGAVSKNVGRKAIIDAITAGTAFEGFTIAKA